MEAGGIVKGDMEADEDQLKVGRSGPNPRIEL